jgi:hypothetical protein
MRLLYIKIYYIKLELENVLECIKKSGACHGYMQFMIRGNKNGSYILPFHGFLVFEMSYFRFATAPFPE